MLNSFTAILIQGETPYQSINSKAQNSSEKAPKNNFNTIIVLNIILK